ncbi:glycosyltransferase family 4 protein [Patescibacteria group bacterium]
MRIGIDARFYGPKKQKGLGRYVKELISGLEKIDNNCEFIIFLRKNNWDEYYPVNNKFKKVLADYKWYGFAEQIFFPFKIWKAKVDLMHFPHFNVPLFCPVDFVVTIHDLILKHFPTRKASTLGPILYFIKNYVYRFVIWISVKRAKKIITVSEYTKKDILDSFNIEANKVDVIYEGVFTRSLPLDNLGILRKHKIVKSYLLYVGNAYPHKNLEKLILAFNGLYGLQLVLVGQIDYFYRRLKKFVYKKNINNIIFTDFVSDEDLAILYKNADLYIFPSLYEGFGLPPLEAMAYGLPVVCSNSSCLPEILGDAAIYFDPKDINDIINKIKQVLYSQDMRKKLISSGYNRIEKYSWLKMSKKIYDIYIL